jgi:DNA-binding response OmpR family regulator
MYRVLVLDDNRDILEAISLVLTRKEIDVVALQDASQLTHSLQEYKPDLLLMDISMGRYDGRDLCRKIKLLSDDKELPVVLFTAQTCTPESIVDAHANAFIEKPFKMQQLYDLVDSFRRD